jgi:antitoxin CptB
MTFNTASLSMPDNRESLDVLRRKLRFRAWHRGTQEADLLIGTFADQCLPGFTADELRQFERLLEEDDPVIDHWITGRQFVPAEHDNSVAALLRRFCLRATLKYPDKSPKRESYARSCKSSPSRHLALKHRNALLPTAESDTWRSS